MALQEVLEMVLLPNLLEVRRIPIENGFGDEDIPKVGKNCRSFGKSRLIFPNHTAVLIGQGNLAGPGVSPLDVCLSSNQISRIAISVSSIEAIIIGKVSRPCNASPAPKAIIR